MLYNRELTQILNYNAFRHAKNIVQTRIHTYIYMSSWAAGKKPIFYQRFMQQDDNKNKYFAKVIIFSEGALPRSEALPQGTLPRSFKDDLCLCA